MSVLLDECVNPRVKAAFADHEVQTVKGMGWGGITNGKLMALAQQSRLQQHRVRCMVHAPWGAVAAWVSQTAKKSSASIPA